jgi:hypothetical protein
VDPRFFDGVAEACRSLSPPELGPVQVRSHRYGTKAWFGGAAPTKEHYEAQVVGAQHVPGATVLAVEVGFHAEHPTVEDNQAAVDRLIASESAWRRQLGDQVVVGPFLGRADRWRRASETWLDPDLEDDELVLELALRMVDYFSAFEPLRRA